MERNYYWGVLVLLQSVQILVRDDWYFLMEACKSARPKTSKIHGNEHTPEVKNILTYFQQERNLKFRVVLIFPKWFKRRKN